MSSIIFVKTSSLGDVVHHMPAVTEARRARPEAHIAWLVEEAYAPLVALHPAVDAVVPVATRRWRSTWYRPGEIGAIRRVLTGLRERAYDDVIDTQGLLRTGILTRILRGRRHGYDRASVREFGASLFYDVRHGVSRSLHAIDRNRMLTGAALGYTPGAAFDFGLRQPSAADARDYAVLLHGTAEARKEWTEEGWLAVGRELAAGGLRTVLPWGAPRERERAERLARMLPRAEAIGGAGLGEIARLIGGARAVIGLDTGLTHLAAAFRVPVLCIFVASDPKLTAPRGNGAITVLGANGAPPAAAAVTSALQQLLVSQTA